MNKPQKSNDDTSAYFWIAIAFVGVGISFLVNESLRGVGIPFLILGVTFFALSVSDKKKDKDKK